MLIDAALGLINHILGQEGWARHRLKAFSSQIIRLDVGPLESAFSITTEGYFKSVALSSPPTVSLTLTTHALFQSLSTHKPLEGDVQIRGSARLAECLLTILKALHWDIEDDLSQLIGDIAARRLVLRGRRLSKLTRTQVLSVAHSVADYLRSEIPVLPRRNAFIGIAADVDAAHKSLDALEERVSCLEQQPGPP